MLREIFRTEPLHYHTAATSGRNSYGLFGPYNEWIPEPHQEAVSSLTGMYVLDNAPTLYSIHNIYVWMIISSKFWPGWGIALQRFDSVSGKWLQRVGVGSSIGSIFATDRVIRSRNGKLYTTNRGWELLNFYMAMTKPEEGDDREDPQPQRQTYTGENIIPSHFEGVGSVFVGSGGLGACLIDEPADTFIMGGDNLSVFFLGSGKHRWTVPLPGGTQNVCLEDAGHCYALCDNRELVLYDYIRNEVLGVSKVPMLGVRGAPVVMAWDWVRRRILICEQQPDLPTGYSQTRIVGYRAVPEPVRITMPVPLRAPRRGRIVPVLAQVVGDMNEGVGGFPVNATVTGDAALVGITLTDGLGRAVARVRCALPLPTTGGSTPEIPSTIEELTYTVVSASGTQPDIGYYSGSTYLVYVDGGSLIVQKDGMTTYTIGMNTAIMFGGQPHPRVVGKSCVFRNGTAAVSWEDLDMGPASWVTFLTAVWGDHPVVMNATMQGVQTTGYAIRRRHRSTGIMENVGMGNAHGLSRILSTGDVVLYDADAVRKDADGNIWGHNASFASSLIACEGLSGGVVVRMNDEASTELVLWPGVQCVQPRIAVYQGDVTVVCQSAGVKMAQFPVSMILGYAPGNAGGTATGTGGGTGAGTDPLAPVIGRDLWFGYFHQFSDRFGDNPNAPGNVTVVLDASKIAPALAAGKKLIVGDNAFRTVIGHEADVIATFCAGNTVEELEAAAASLLANMPPTLSTKPVFGMLNTTEMPSAAVAGVDWLGLVCYVLRDENAFAAHARVQNALNDLDDAHEAYFLIGQAYTANNDYTDSPQELVSAQYLPANLAKADTRVTGILMYSDGQSSGTRDHEQWRPIHAAIFAGIGEDGVETPIGAYDGPPGTFRIKMEVTMAEPPLTPQSVGVPGAGGGGGGAGGGGGDGGGSASGGHPWMTVNGTLLDYKGVSAFASFIRWLDGDTGCIAAICAWAKAEGYTVIRVLGMFGHPLWVGEGYDYYPGDGTHSESEYYSELTEFANYIAGEGLTLEWVPFADVGYISKYDDPANRLAHAASCTTALLGIGPVVIEICNEPPFNGLEEASDLKVLADKVKEVDSSRKVALGCESGGAWTEMTYAIPPSDYLTFHANRSSDWTWVMAYYGSNVLMQTERFPIEDEPQHPEDDPEEGRFFALGCLSRILEFGLTFHFSEGLWGEVPAGHAAVCGEAMAEGLRLATYGFGGEVFKDFGTGSPLQSTSANPLQVVGRKTAGTMQLIAMGCPVGWTPQYAGGWVQTAITKRGTNDCAQFITATLSDGGTGGSTATAPNMLSTLNLTYASRTWRFNQGASYDQTASDGRGAYIEKAVDDLHALNANWGHLRVISGGYQNHSLDSIAWKRPDATAVEIYKVISGAGVIQWVFVSAFESDLANWFYDA